MLACLCLVGVVVALDQNEVLAVAGDEDESLLQGTHRDFNKPLTIKQDHGDLTEADLNALNEDVPESVVNDKMNDFEKNYNLGDMTSVSSIYAANTWVSVNDGVVFNGTKPAEVAEFLGQLRNDWGCENIEFVITSVEGSIVTDTWTCDIGTGSCKATWEFIGEEWVIVADEITFVAYTEKQLQKIARKAAQKKAKKKAKKAAVKKVSKACKQVLGTDGVWHKDPEKACTKACEKTCNTAIEACKKANKRKPDVCTLAAGRWPVAPGLPERSQAMMVYYF